MTRGFLARRLGKKPEQITRWLGAPGNWTLETLSNLLVAMGYEPQFSAQPLDQIPSGNYFHPASVEPTRNAPSSLRFEGIEQQPKFKQSPRTLVIEK
jgi:hypothetical protein